MKNKEELEMTGLDRVPRSDKGKKRVRPSGMGENCAGRRENPETGEEEMWCAHCQEYKVLDFFDKKINAPRSKRACVNCEERIAKSRMALSVQYDIGVKPPKSSTFANEAWRYLKRDLGVQPKGRGKRPGLKGHPPVKGKRAKAINHILGNIVTPLPIRYRMPIVQIVLDPQDKVNYRTRLWLALRPDVLDKRMLRLCCTEFVVNFAASAFEDHNSPTYHALTGVFEDMRAIRNWDSIGGRDALHGLKQRVEAIELDSLDLNRTLVVELQGTAAKLFPAIQTIFRGDLFLAYRVISFYLFEHLVYTYSDRKAAWRHLLDQICDAIRLDVDARQRKLVLGTTRPLNPDHPKVGTIRQEYDHPSSTRLLVVFDVRNRVARLRVIYNPDDRAEVGREYEIPTADLDDVGPGSYGELSPEFLEECNFSIPILNEKLMNWGLKPLPTDMDRHPERYQFLMS